MADEDKKEAAAAALKDQEEKRKKHAEKDKKKPGLPELEDEETAPRDSETGSATIRGKVIKRKYKPLPELKRAKKIEIPKFKKLEKAEPMKRESDKEKK